MHANEENVNNDVSKDSPIVSLTLTNFNIVQSKVILITPCKA